MRIFPFTVSPHTPILLIFHELTTVCKDVQYDMKKYCCIEAKKRIICYCEIAKRNSMEMLLNYEKIKCECICSWISLFLSHSPKMMFIESSLHTIINENHFIEMGGILNMLFAQMFFLSSFSLNWHFQFLCCVLFVYF